MLSRLADALYWMSRYMERAENVARFLDVTLHMSLDVPGSSTEQWEPLVTASGDHQLFAEQYPSFDEASVVRFLTFDAANPNSIFSCVAKARENARIARQFITLEMWEQLNEHYLLLKDLERQKDTLDLSHDFYTDVMMASQLFQGITDATMSRGEGWHWCRVGRKLERADKTSRLLDVKYYRILPSESYTGTPYDDILWAAVLRSTSAFEMYRKQYHQITPQRVSRFLILDREFPRAIQHCVIAADESLRAINSTPTGFFHNPAEKTLGRLRAELAYTEVEEIFASGLHEFLDRFQVDLNNAGVVISETYFALHPLSGDNPSGASQ